jgi:hypothetical protein
MGVMLAIPRAPTPFEVACHATVHGLRHCSLKSMQDAADQLLHGFTGMSHY